MTYGIVTVCVLAVKGVLYSHLSDLLRNGKVQSSMCRRQPPDVLEPRHEGQVEEMFTCQVLGLSEAKHP